MKELTLLDSFMEARIWIVNMDGKVIGDTRRILGSNINVFQHREDFLEHTFLEDVHFKGVFTEPMLSVTVPITYQYSVKGYLCLHASMQEIKQESVYYLDFINIFLNIFILF